MGRVLTSAGVLLLSLPAVAADPAYLRLKRVQIIDRHGFEKPVPAMSMLVPTDWSFDGEVRYSLKPGGDPADLARLAFRTASPDARLSIEMFPGWGWTWADDPMMRQAMQQQAAMTAQMGGARTELAPPMGARDFLTRVAVPRLRPGARVLGVEPIPDLDAPLQAQVKQAEQLAAQAGVPMRLKADQARARLQVAGKAPGEEWLTAVVYTRATAMPSMSPGTGQMRQTALYQTSADQLFALHTPAGELPAREKLFRTVLSTVRVDPTWQARLSQVQANMAASNVQSASDRSKIIAKSAEDQRRIIREGYENRQRSADRNAERWSDAMRGVQNFRDPRTGEDVKLSNQYAHAWVNGNGEYVMSDSSGNPGQVLQGHWTELQPVKH